VSIFTFIGGRYKLFCRVIYGRLDPSYFPATHGRIGIFDNCKSRTMREKEKQHFPFDLSELFRDELFRGSLVTSNPPDRNIFESELI